METDPTPSPREPDDVDALGALSDAMPAGEARPVDLRDYVDFSPDRATRVRVFATPRLAQDLWGIEPMQSTGVLQYADTDVTYTVIGGRSWFVTEQGEVGLDPMGSLLVPAGTIHGIDNRGADPLIVLAASAPPEPHGEDTPVADAAIAVRDDSRYGQLGERVRTVVDNLLRR